MAEPQSPPGPARPFNWRNLGASVLINAVAPLILYDQLQHRVGSTTTALVIAGGIPLVWTAGRLIMRRRLDPIGLLSLALRRAQTSAPEAALHHAAFWITLIAASP